MCSLACRKFWQNIILMVSSDNPDRICKPGSISNNTFRTVSTIIVISSAITLIYFLTIGLGFGMTVAIVGNTYNMTTGIRFDSSGCYRNSPCAFCYNDQGGSLYFCCFLVGLICELLLALTIGLFIGLFFCWINCLSPYFSNIKLEVVKSFESAQNMNTENEGTIACKLEQNTSIQNDVTTSSNIGIDITDTNSENVELDD
jgi:hypothetical protein